MATNKEKILHLKEMLQNNYSLSVENYYKCLIGLSYELFLEQELDLALSFLQEIPQDYYLKILPQQLQNDPLFTLYLRAYLDLLNNHKLLNNISFFNHLDLLKNTSQS